MNAGPTSTDPVAAYNTSTRENAVLYVPAGNSPPSELDALCNGIGGTQNHSASLFPSWGGISQPAIISASGQTLAYQTSPDKHLWRYILSNGTLQATDITPFGVIGLVGGIGAAYLGSSEAVYYVSQDVNPPFAYRIARMQKTTGPWQSGGVIQAVEFNQPSPMVRSGLSPNLAVYSSSSIGIVAFQSTGFDICEFYTNAGSWHWWCPTQLAGVPTTASGQPSLAYTTKYHFVAYRDGNNAVHLLAHSTKWVA
jgi:hypothetical protein